MPKECMTFNELSLWIRDYINSTDTNKQSIEKIKKVISKNIAKSKRNDYIGPLDEEILSDRIKYLLELKVFNDAIDDMVDQYIKESVLHFIHKRYSFADDGRYLHSKRELEKFLTGYKEKGGDLSTIHIGIIYNNDRPDEFECYEIVHRNTWKIRPDLCWATGEIHA